VQSGAREHTQDLEYQLYRQRQSYDDEHGRALQAARAEAACLKQALNAAQTAIETVGRYFLNSFLTCLLTYSLTCLLACLLTYSLTCLLAYLLTYLLACLLT